MLLQKLNLLWLAPVAASTIVLSLWFSARARLFYVMLKRTRWLRLTMAVLFATMTPGLLLPPPWSLGVVALDGLLLL